MGVSSSKIEQDIQRIQHQRKYFSQLWNSFIEDCCIKDECEHIPIQNLESLFANYMRMQAPHELYDNYVELANLYIVELVLNEKLKITPGWLSFEQKIDTRLVTGLKVVRLSGKK